MTKLYFDPISVTTEDGRPRSFVWRRTAHPISTVLKRWIVRVDWWRKEISRHYYKVQCENGGTYEIYREHDVWYLERLYD